MKLLSIFILAMLCASCAVTSGEEEIAQDVVAVAGEQELRADELKELLIPASNAGDSASIRKKLIDKWATDVLFYEEALSKLTDEEIQIEREVQAYKRSLVNHIYQTRLIEANLDTLVTREEIKEYYDAHRDNFILKDNIVKVNYFKVPLKVQVLDKMKKLMYAAQAKDKEQLQALSVQYADNFFTNDSTWLYLDDVKKEIPKLRDQPEVNILNGKIFEFTDDFYFYFLRIKDVRVKNGLSPLNFERQNIRNFILHQRKTQLIEQYKNLLLEKAKENRQLKILKP